MLKEPKALLEKLPTLEEAELLAEKVQEAYNKLRRFKMVMKVMPLRSKLKKNLNPISTQSEQEAESTYFECLEIHQTLTRIPKGRPICYIIWKL